MFQDIFEFIQQMIDSFGKYPLCNFNANHGIFINGFCLPLCARCTGAFIGYIITIFIFLFIVRKIKYNLILHLIFISFSIPCIIDGSLQYFWNIESNLFRRLVTGFFLGSSIVLSIGYTSVMIDEKINRDKLFNV